MVVALLAPIMTFAGGGDYMLRSGDPKVVCVKGLVMGLEFDYSECLIWDMKEDKFFSIEDYVKFRGEDWQRDLPEELRKAEEAFVEKFNDKSDYALVSPQATSADYTMVFKLNEFSYGRNVIWSSNQAGWATGEVIIRNKAGEKVAVYMFTKALGDCGAGAGMFEARRQNSYEEVAKNIAKRLNKLK